MPRGQESFSGRRFRGWVEGLLGLLYPDKCLFCKGFIDQGNDSLNKPLCASCSKYYRPGGQICPRCGGFSRILPPCNCLEHNYKDMPLRALFTISLYDQRWRQVVHDLKYRNRRAAARALGAWLGKEITDQGYCQPEAVVPIPLHRQKEKERGYNQSALLALYAAEQLKVPCRQLLVKIKESSSQTTTSRLKRRENVRAVFKSADSIKPGMKVLLVDDVYSTGATMQEAAAVLNKADAEVFGAVVSYNPGTLTLKRTGFYDGLDWW